MVRQCEMRLTKRGGVWANLYDAWRRADKYYILMIRRALLSAKSFFECMYLFKPRVVSILCLARQNDSKL